jgi:hypothetical protein
MIGLSALPAGEVEASIASISADDDGEGDEDDGDDSTIEIATTALSNDEENIEFKLEPATERGRQHIGGEIDDGFISLGGNDDDPVKHLKKKQKLLDHPPVADNRLLAPSTSSLSTKKKKEKSKTPFKLYGFKKAS